MHDNIEESSVLSMDQKKHQHAAFPWFFWISAALLITLKIWLARGLTFNAIGYMFADDRLFIEQAGSILQGEWLGNYNYLTLFKGSFYPIFIAFSYLIGLPLLTTQHLLYAVACLVFCQAVSPLLRRQVLLVLVLAVLLFNPMSVTNTVATRALREGIYPALTLLNLAGAIGLVLRLDKPINKWIAWSALTGICLSAFWLTREERIWILPALAILICLAIIRNRIEKSNWRAAIIGLCIPMLMLGAAVMTICGLNDHDYGVFSITEYDNPVFLRAYGSLTRVTPATWQPLIPVAAETRRRIYAVSPTFAQLEPWLEGNIGALYARYGEGVKNDSHEMGGGWFHTALRESIDAAGLTADGKFPQNFYRQMTSEIDDACDSGSLDCGPERSSFMAVWNNAYLPPLIKNFKKAASYMLNYEGYDGSLKDCLGTDAQLKLFIDLSREKCWHTQPSVLAQGWVVRPGESISIWVYDNAGNKIVSPTYHMQSPDLVERFQQMGVDAPEASIARFQIEADCPASCYLVVKADDGSILTRIDLARPSGTADRPDENGLYYEIESIDWRKGDEVDNPVFELNSKKSRLLEKLALIYQKTIPLLAVPSLLLFVIQTVVAIIKRKGLPLWTIELALLAAILTRLVMVAWLETSSINAIITTYLSPNYPLLLIFLMLPFCWVVEYFPTLQGSKTINNPNPR
jgi:hypothetical protein